MIKRRFQYNAAFAFETLEHLIGCYLAYQDEKSSAVRFYRGGSLLHPFVVNPDVRQISAESAGRRPERRACQGHQENQADQRSPKHSGDCADRRGADELVEFDVPVSVLDGDCGVAQFDQVVFLHRQQFLTNGFRSRFGGKRNYDEISHGSPPSKTAVRSTSLSPHRLKNVQPELALSRSQNRSSSTGA